MGCFLRCFGSSKDQKRRKKRNKVQRDQRNASCNLVQSAVSSVQVESEKPINSVSEIRDRPEEQSNLSPRKKVTFDTNVTTYEHLDNNENLGLLQECEKFGKNKDENLAKFSPPKCSSEDSLVTSSLGSYPPNHRYQNCPYSDDYDEELNLEDSDLDDEDDDEDEDNFNDDDGELEYEDGINESKSGMDEEANNPLQTVCEGEVRQTGLNCNARDRSGYVHSVLNPVENLTQWRAVKAKGASASAKPRKENSTLDQEPRISFSSNPSFKVDKPKQEIAVDASLSNWLVSSEVTPVKKTTSTFGLDSTPETVTSQGSNSIKSKEDRPILGALTVEELRQFSASSSPRKSPRRRSPDEMPIIGTVGTYWNQKGSAMNFDSASSFKGIANTNSKMG